jgi:hypothetical protein
MLLVVLAAAALLAGCSGGDDAPAATLLDGSAAPQATVDLEGIEGAVVVTSHSVVSADSEDAESPVATCRDERYADIEASETAIVRIGVATESVTLEEPPDVGILGCDNSAGDREDDRRWCGGSYGELAAGRLNDPRLDILCRTADGTPVGFAWVEPGDGTRYVAVEQPDYTEAYEVAGELPIRIATVSGVDEETSSATFEISEHDAEGRLLREQTLEAFVAG